MTRRRVTALAALVACAVLPAGILAYSPAQAVVRIADSACPVEDPDTASAPGDIDNDGQSDTVVGAPNAADAAGAVDITLSSGTRQRLQEGDLDATDVGIGHAPTPTGGDQFGAAFAVGLFLPNGHCSSVAVGLPGEGDDRGSVAIYAGSVSGLTATDSRWLTGGDPGDRFGTSLVAGDGGLYVGAPGTNHSAGAVYHYSPFAPGNVYRLDRIITQDTAGVPGTSEAGDLFGQTLAMTPHGLLIGAPHEDVGTVRNAGSVTFLPSTVSMKAQVWTQNSAGVPGVAETGDHFGDALAASGSYRAFGNEILIGIPDEGVGALDMAGAVQLLKLNAAGSAYVPGSYYDQNSAGIPSNASFGERFGVSVAFAWQVNCAGKWDAAVGSPGQNTQGLSDNGSVTLLPRGSCPAKVLATGTGALGGTATDHGRLGNALAARAGSRSPDGEPADIHDVLLIGAPGLSQSIAGEVFEASRLGTDSPVVTRLTDSGGGINQEHYGAALGLAMG